MLTKAENTQAVLDAARTLAICLNHWHYTTPVIAESHKTLQEKLLCVGCCTSGSRGEPAVVCGGTEAHPVVSLTTTAERVENRKKAGNA
mgnify:CR=1 FL=1